jgi:pyruvate dehydrogenase E2 component (dihydrolipoamide acetyltransferase)
MARREVTVPDLGDFKNVEIVELLVKAGDKVRAEQPLLTLETDKAAMEIPAPAAGTVIELKVAQGGRVSKGDLILMLDADETAATAAATAATPPASPPVPVAPAATPAPVAPKVAPAGPPPVPRASGTLPPINETTFSQAHASPSVRKFARELGLTLAGSGAPARRAGWSSRTSRPS